MIKIPGFFLPGGARLFLNYAKGYQPWLNVQADSMLSDPRVSDGWDFARAAGDTLSRVNADPRNHFGKHALRRFDND